MLPALLCVSMSVVAAPNSVDQPQASVRQLIADMQALNIAPEGGVLSLKQSQENQVVVEKLRTSLSVKELGQSALATYNKKLTSSQKKEFFELLDELFVKVIYPQAAKFLGKLELAYHSSKSRDDVHVVLVEVSHPDEGLIELEFFLTKSESKWVVRDLLLDGVSLRRDIERQVQMVLKKEGFSGLVTRIRSKF